ncbi:MAG: asparagine synthase (glutamine-hydrolyzing), partial [Cytophagales bacterium]
MCGIAGIISFDKHLSSSHLVNMTEVIQHRGPDDEGYLIWSNESFPMVFNGRNTDAETLSFNQKQVLSEQNGWNVGLGHKRLSILDLSPTGHQPMLHPETGIAISFNGEVYNYKEIRDELLAKGYRFQSQTDTEVILKSWVEWGEQALQKFNGMFALLILDPRNGGKLYALRDRFGVKPLYWTKTKSYMAFGSEIKQLKLLPEFQSVLNQNIAYDYLAYGQLDHSTQTFDQNIFQLFGGEMMVCELSNDSYSIKKWYELPKKIWEGSEKQAIQQFKDLMTDSVKLRLRSDVPVGSCLSGGLDSSTIVCLMADILDAENHKGIKTVTACYENKKYDEWEFAKAVVGKTKADSIQIFPTFDDLLGDLEKLFWHMDEPFGSTSQFSQWSVFKGAAQAGLKVMLDGQGSDEQLAGYNSNEQPMFAGLLKKLAFYQVFTEAKAFKVIHGYWPKAQLLGASRIAFPAIDSLLPQKFKRKTEDYLPVWLNAQVKPLEGLTVNPHTLNDSLRLQTLHTSLPALLRYEDRNSMAFSIESRVPFMDYRLVEFNLSLP